MKRRDIYNKLYVGLLLLLSSSSFHWRVCIHTFDSFIQSHTAHIIFTLKFIFECAICIPFFGDAATAFVAIANISKRHVRFGFGYMCMSHVGYRLYNCTLLPPHLPLSSRCKFCVLATGKCVTKQKHNARHSHAHTCLQYNLACIATNWQSITFGYFVFLFCNRINFEILTNF